MHFYIIYDRKNQPFVRAVMTSYNKAIKAKEELEESSRQMNDIFNKQNQRFIIKKIDANRIYYF